MRQLTPGTPPNDDFDLGGPISPEVKYVNFFNTHFLSFIKTKTYYNTINYLLTVQFAHYLFT